MSADESLIDRMTRAVERVRERLLRATSALGAAGVPYAVVGESAVAAFIAKVDPAAVRNTRRIEVLLRRSDLEAAGKALESVGFVRRDGADIGLFLDGHHAKLRDSVRVVVAAEKTKPDDVTAAPDVTQSLKLDQFRVVSLPALVTFALTSFRLDDCVDLRDLLDVGLIDATWVPRLPPELGARLQHLIDTPEG